MDWMNQEEKESTANEMVIIKRYQNRKLYDTTESKYVKLSEISDIIKEGKIVQVIDNKSKEDITDLTLLQAIFDKEREKVRNGNSTMTVDHMRQMIKAQ